MASIELINSVWFIDGDFWPEYFVTAIFPVESQRIKAADLRQRNFDRLADALEWSADADEECEVKWNARTA